MTAIAIVGAKGAPGATVLALALAAIVSELDQRPALLVEADPAGGDIAARCGVPLDPGLLTLAASGRRGLDRSSIEHHSQLLPCGALALLAPTSAEQAASVLTGVAATLAQTLANETSTVIIDAGRWDPNSPAAALVASASSAVLVLRPTIEGVEHARWQLPSLPVSAARMIAVSIGERPYPRADVRAALAVNDLYVIDDDEHAATALGMGARPSRWLRRSPLMRSTAALAERLLEERVQAAVLR